MVWAGVIDRATIAHLDDFPHAISALPPCQVELIKGCWWDAEQFHVPAGASRLLNIPVPLEIGSHELVAFVGGPDYGLRLGQEYYKELRVDVTPQSNIQLFANLQSSVRGYWSDGTANIELAGTIGNSGYQAQLANIPARFICQRQRDGAGNCESGFEVKLANGFGPEQFRSVVRIPVGEPLIVNLEILGRVYASIAITVPEKILGVKRFIWDCYSARSGYSGRNPLVRLRCSGWDLNRVDKWWQQSPVKVRVVGPEPFKAVLRTVLAEVAPLLNLEFEYVESEQEAQVRAFVGVPQSSSSEIWGSTYCEEFAGCASTNVNSATGIVSSGLFNAWGYDGRPPDLSIATISHEVLHVMAAVGHRETPDHVMLFPLSPTDKALLQLNSHPLVRPGMSMSQVRNVIVLEDELLDAVPSSAIELVWRTAEITSQFGSIQFDLSGQWSGPVCRTQPFGPIKYEVSELGYETSKLAHVQTAEHEYWHHSGKYWTWEDGRWQSLSEYGVQIESGWSHQQTDPLPMLRWLAVHGATSGISFADMGDGLINLTADTVVVPDGWMPISDLQITIDPNSFKLLGYQMTRQISDSCALLVSANNGTYGGELIRPLGLD